MKIILVTPHFLPKYCAGTEQYVRRAADALERRGHAVEVVCVESIAEGTLVPTCTTDLYQGIPVHRLWFNLDLAPNPLQWRFRNPELGRWFQAYLDRTAPDIVHVNSGYLLGGTVFEAAFERQIPTVLTLHDYWFMCPLITLFTADERVCARPVAPIHCVWCQISDRRRYRLPDRYLGGMLRRTFVRLGLTRAARATGLAGEIERIEQRRGYLSDVMQSVDVAIAPSRFMERKAEEYGLTPRRLIHLPFGVDVDRPDPAPLTSTPGALRVGYMGQYVPHKGVHVLLDAFRVLVARRPASELFLYGPLSEGTAYERRLAGQIRRTSGVSWAGSYPNEQVGRILSNLDVTVVPSLWYENRPTVILEAHAARTPVVATRLGGMLELVRDGEGGVLFERGDAAGLAGALRRLIDEPDLLPRLKAGIPRVPGVDEEIEQLLGVYASLGGPGGGRGSRTCG
jgi:glycosyltransferase involved in cell wall biosynthesis